MMVLPLQVFVRIVMKQRKYNTVPRISFVQEMIAVFISYWTMHLSYSTMGSKKANNCHLPQSPWCRSSIQHTVCVNVLELSLTTKNVKCLEVCWFIPFILQMRKQPVREKQNELPQVSQCVGVRAGWEFWFLDLIPVITCQVFLAEVSLCLDVFK